uniref:Uncharacterized protein n=1 Tax=Anguilla anguilla TaxID=7936 RepID=A0A0E9V132_ANGAN
MGKAPGPSVCTRVIPSCL